MNDIYLDPKWFEIMGQRNELLQQTDWTMLPDVELTEEQKTEAKIYRQALRDITKNYTNPNDVVFPTKPNFIN
jgi:hypothetical protein